MGIENSPPKGLYESLKHDLQALHARNQKLQERLEDAIVDKIQTQQELDNIHHGIALEHTPSRGFFNSEDLKFNLRQSSPIEEMIHILRKNHQPTPCRYENLIVTNTSRLAYVLMGAGADNALTIAFRISYMVTYLGIDIDHISVLTCSEHHRQRISHHLSALLPLFVDQYLCDDIQNSIVQTFESKLTQCIHAVHDNTLLIHGAELAPESRVNDTREIEHLFNRYGARDNPVKSPHATWRKFKRFACSMRHILISDFDSASDAAIEWVRFYLNYSINHLRNGSNTSLMVFGADWQRIYRWDWLDAKSQPMTAQGYFFPESHTTSHQHAQRQVG